MKNKFIASALSFALVISSLPSLAMAANASDKATKTEVVKENNVVTYQDNFSIDYYVTGGNSNAIPEESFTGGNYMIADNAMNIARGDAKVVATNPVGEWMTSSIWTPSASYSTASKIQIPVTQASNGLKMKGWGGFTSAVNLVLDDTSLGKVYDVHYKAKIGSRSVRFLIDSTENSYYEIGYVNNDRTMVDGTIKSEIPAANAPGTEKKMGRPYFRKVVGGVEAELDMANVTVVSNSRTKSDGTEDGTFTLQTVPADSGLSKPTKALYLSDYWYTNGTNINYIDGTVWAEFDANINYDTNTIRVSILSDKWGGIVFDYVDNGLSALADGAIYPVAFTSTNDGWAEVSSFSVSYSERALSYGFSQLNAENSTIYDNTVTLNNKETFCVVDDADMDVKFITSAFYNGFPHQPDIAGSVRHNGGVVYLKDRYRQGTTLNLDYPMESVKSVEAKTGAASGICHGVRLFISEDERTYYEFMSGDGMKPFTTTAGQRVVPGNKVPFIRKVTDGLTISVDVCDDDWSSVSADDTLSWSAEVKDNALQLSVTNGSISWSYTYNDADINSVVANCNYPMAFTTYGDGESKLYSVAIEGTKRKNLIKDNSDGTVDIAVYPQTAENDVTAVTAFYDADGGFIESKNLACSKTQLTEISYTKPDGTAETKCFIFDGQPTEGKLLNPIERDTKVTTSENIIIACVGDSLTEGHGSTDNVRYSYPGQLQRLLGAGYTVENFGRGSRKILDTGEVDSNDGSSLTYTKYVGTWSGQHSFNRQPESIYEASKACNPDIIVIMLGTNDRNNITTEEARTEFKENYRAILKDYTALSSDPEIFIVLPPSNLDEKGNANMGNYMLPILKDLAKEENVKLINIYDTVSTDLLVDALHFGNAGYKEVANVVYNAILGNPNSISYTDAEITINPAAGTTSNVYAASYKDGRLQSVVALVGKTLRPAEENSVDISTLDTENADCIKLMAFDTENGVEPEIRLSVKNANSISENSGVYLVSGKESNVLDSNVIIAVDAAGNIVYINNSLSDYDANYSYSFAANDVAAIYVDGTVIH